MASKKRKRLKKSALANTPRHPANVKSRKIKYLVAAGSRVMSSAEYNTARNQIKATNVINTSPIKSIRKNSPKPRKAGREKITGDALTAG